MVVDHILAAGRSDVTQAKPLRHPGQHHRQLVEDDLTGPVNLAAPNPLPHRSFMCALRAAQGMPVGLPATSWMAEIGAFLIRTDTELLLKSRRVVPGRLLEAGFTFDYPQWPEAARDLVAQHRTRRTAPV